MKFYWFTFEDGYRYCTRAMDRAERAAAIRKHGKIISKVPA